MSGEAIWVTADDHGLSAETNEAIFAARGQVTAVSAMAHEGARMEGLERLAGEGLFVGAHLCFTGPGRARDFRALARELACSPGRARGLLDDADRQLDRLERVVGTPCFVNGHEHVHLFPWLWGGVARRARERKIPAIRAAIGQGWDRSAEGILAAASDLAWALWPGTDLFVTSPLGVGHTGEMGVERAAMLLDRPFEAGRDRARELVFHPREGSTDSHVLLGGGLGRLLESRGLRIARRG